MCILKNKSKGRNSLSSGQESSGMHFSIEGEELERLDDFQKKHCHKEIIGMQGDSFEYHFYHTGFGIISSVKCVICGEEECLTDMDKL